MRAIVSALLVVAAATLPLHGSAPSPRGALVVAGHHRLHVYCTGAGAPTVAIETGLGDFSFDWDLVQQRVARVTRVCTYDRAGYAWSEPGPKPRTFDQLNLELHEALAAAGEPGPFVLVGHSYGGGPARNYVLRYPRESAGLVLVEAVGDTQYIVMGPTAEQLLTFAKGRAIPPPRDDLASSDRPAALPAADGATAEPLDPELMALPAAIRSLHEWAMRQPGVDDAETSQKEWSSEYIARWASQSQEGVLGDLPLVVLARKDGGYPDGLNRPAAELEAARLESQRRLAGWSRHGRLQLVPAGHNMHLEVPQVVADAIGDVVAQARKRPSASRGSH